MSRAADALVALGKTFLPTARKSVEEMKQPDFADERFKKMMEEQKKMQIGMLDVSDKLLEGTKVTHVGKKMKIETRVMGGLGDAVKLVTQSWVGTMRFVESASIDVEETVEDIDKADK